MSTRWDGPDPTVPYPAPETTKLCRVVPKFSAPQILVVMPYDANAQSNTLFAIRLE